MKDINAEEYSELMNSEDAVVIDFHATWCGPCKVLSPILEELEDEVNGLCEGLIKGSVEGIGLTIVWEDDILVSGCAFNCISVVTTLGKYTLKPSCITLLI